MGQSPAVRVENLLNPPSCELLFMNWLLYVRIVASIECAAWLENGILLLIVVISCIMWRVGRFLGIIGAPYQKVATTLLWIIVVSVTWSPLQEKWAWELSTVDESLWLHIEKACHLRLVDTGRLYRIWNLSNNLNPHWCFLQCTWLYKGPRG